MSLQKMKPISYALKIYQKGKEVYNHYTSSSWRFFNFLKAIDFTELKRNKPYHVFLRVGYGKHEDTWGKMVRFYNSGSYTTKKDLWFAFRAFTEK